jgi:hypothetical protein
MSKIFITLLCGAIIIGIAYGALNSIPGNQGGTPRALAAPALDTSAPTPTITDTPTPLSTPTLNYSATKQIIDNEAAALQITLQVAQATDARAVDLTGTAIGEYHATETQKVSINNDHATNVARLDATENYKTKVAPTQYAAMKRAENDAYFAPIWEWAWVIVLLILAVGLAMCLWNVGAAIYKRQSDPHGWDDIPQKEPTPAPVRQMPKVIIQDNTNNGPYIAVTQEEIPEWIVKLSAKIKRLAEEVRTGENTNGRDFSREVWVTELDVFTRGEWDAVRRYMDGKGYAHPVNRDVQNSPWVITLPGEKFLKHFENM